MPFAEQMSGGTAREPIRGAGRPLSASAVIREILGFPRWNRHTPVLVGPWRRMALCDVG